MKTRTFLLVTVLLVLTAQHLYPCSTLVLRQKGEVVFGRNFDYPFGYGMVFFNPRLMHKTALCPKGEVRLEWDSRYDNITFNQLGQELPMGGMNEKGLVVALMYLKEAIYPEKDERPGIYELQWVQYQLDNSATTTEVIESLKQLRISDQSRAPLHYLICDATGHSALIEFLDGQPHIFSGANFPIEFATNATYAKSMNALRQFEGFGGKRAIPACNFTSIYELFALGAQKMQPKCREENLVSKGFEVLKSVGNEDQTQWSIVFSPQKREIHFISRVNQNQRTLSMLALPEQKNGQVMAFGVDSQWEHSSTPPFTAVTPEMQRKWLEVTYEKTNDLIPVITRTMADAHIRYLKKIRPTRRVQPIAKK